MTSSNPLARSLTLPCGQILPNRLAKAAMSENLATLAGEPTPSLIRLYERFARSGAGLLITGNVIVDPAGRTETNNVVVVDERWRDPLTRWARAAKAEGSRIWMQISHAGRQTPRMVTWNPIAPSAVPLRGMGGLFSRPRALEHEEIEILIGRFVQLAKLAESTGFDGVQVHAAHGYLLSQFLSPRTNLRSDAWGGPLEKRMRFLLEIVRGIRGACSRSFALGVKLNSADFQRGGFTEDESMQVARMLEAEGIDLLEISGGTYERPAMVDSERARRASTVAREAYFLEYARKIRERVSLPLMVTGGFRTAAVMRDALEGGAVDVIGMARPLTVQPDLPAALVRGEVDGADPIRARVGIRLFDDMLQIQWFQAQLAKMAKGQEPDPDLGRWSTLLRGLGHNYVQNVRSALTAPAAPLRGEGGA